MADVSTEAKAASQPYRCPTPCDDDCEINGWGCHEGHQVPTRRDHDPGACEALMLAGNLRWLIDAGWRVALCRYEDRDAGLLDPFFAALTSPRENMHVQDGVSPGDALAKARAWSERERIMP
jgi:hypothetical protein